MNYEYENYDNLEQLEKVDSKLANELVKNFLNEDGKIQSFMVFPNKVEFAKHEVDFRLEIIDWGSGVDPLEYIDFDRLADDLIKDWDRSLYYASDEGKIVRTTSYGF